MIPLSSSAVLVGFPVQVVYACQAGTHACTFILLSCAPAFTNLCSEGQSTPLGRRQAGKHAATQTPLQRAHSCILRMHTNTVHKQSRARGGAVAGLCCCSTARRRFQPSWLCHLCVVPEFATGGCCINSWITAFLIS